MIERKAAGEEIAIAAAPEEDATPAPDLMAALKASLDAVRANDGDSGNGGGKAKPKAPRKPAAKAPARKSGSRSKAGAKS
jgi:DNA end-binding protein Ku